MMKRMWAFVIIIASVILACSIMFYTFDRQQIFSDTLLNTYYMLYGNVTFPHLSLSQSFIAVAVTFVLGVFFLNMLVSILNDSFNTTQKLKVLKDAHERLEILLESINVRKIFIRCRRRNSKPGYLAFCETVHDYDKDDETDTIDIKDRVKIIQNKMNESELTLQNQIDYLKSKILETESKVDGLKDSQKKIMEKLDSFSNYPKESIKVKDSKSSKIKFTEVERIEKKIQFTE